MPKKKTTPKATKIERTTPPPMERVYVWVPPELRLRLFREADKLPRPNNSVSDLIRKLIQQEYPEPESDLSA